MSEENDNISINVILFLILCLFAIIGLVTFMGWIVGGPCFLAKAQMCRGVEPIIGGVYQFEDDSICPCQSGGMLFDRECNTEINRLLDRGYEEVKFCEGGQVNA